MSRTRKGSKADGWEVWSRRPSQGRGPYTKMLANRRERRRKVDEA